MSDFNLSAEIALQLAQGSAAKLKRELQDQFKNLTVDVDDASLSAAKKRAAKAIEVPIKFKTDGAVDVIQKQLAKKPIKIAAEFDKASVRSNLTNAKLNDLIKNRDLKINIGVKLSGAAAREVKKYIKEIERLKKASAQSQKASTGDLPLPKGNEIDAVIDKILSLKDASNDLNATLSTQAPKGRFYQAAAREIENLQNTIGREGIIARFAGLDEQAAKNLRTNLNALFREFTKLDSLQFKLNTAGTEFGIDPSKLSEQTQLIDQTRDALAGLLRTFDAGNPAAFASRISEATFATSDSINKLVRNSQRDFRDYDRLITQLNQKRESFVTSGASPDTVSLIDNQIAVLKSFQSSGVSLDEAKSSPNYQKIKALVDQLRFVDVITGRINVSIESLGRKLNTGEFANSIAAVSSNLQSQVQAIQDEASKKINAVRNDPDAINKIQDIKNEAGEKVTNLKKRVDSLNGIIEKVQNSIFKFKAGGFDRATDGAKKLLNAVLNLAAAGSSIQDISNYVNESFANLGALKSFEGQIRNIDKTLAHLNRTLKYTGQQDFADTRGQLKDLENQLAQMLAAPSFDRKATEQFAADKIFDIRQGEKINDIINKTAGKFQYLLDAAHNPTEAANVQKYFDTYINAAQKTIQSTDTLANKYAILKDNAERSLSSLKGSESILTSISKAGALAAKRLLAFLVFAQGLYKIQSTISQSFSDSVGIDKSFIKLEQVLNKTFSGNELENNVKNVSQQVLDLGADFGILTDSASAATQVLAQAGIVGQNLTKILDTVAKSELGPSFGSAAETAEASIAIMNQFGLSADGVSESLGGISRISAKYAVEAQGITEAVRRAGGVFSNTGGTIDEFAAAFTIVKQQTREADESIATGLRNVAQRLQSSKIQEYLKNMLNVDVVDDGVFIGFNNSIVKIGKALESLPKGSVLRAQVIQQIAGLRQSGRIQPLIEDFAQLVEVSDEFKKGAKSIEEDVGVAFKSIENKLARAKGAFNKLVVELVRSPVFKSLVDAFTTLVTLTTKLLSGFNSIQGALLGVGVALKYSGLIAASGKNILSSFISKGGIPLRNKGGLIPGNGPNKDSVLTYLTKGEYVIQRSAVQTYGEDFFNMANAKKLAGGGSTTKTLSKLANVGSAASGSLDISKIKSGIDFVAKKLFSLGKQFAGGEGGMLRLIIAASALTYAFEDTIVRFDDVSGAALEGGTALLSTVLSLAAFSGALGKVFKTGPLSKLLGSGSKIDAIRQAGPAVGAGANKTKRAVQLSAYKPENLEDLKTAGRRVASQKKSAFNKVLDTRRDGGAGGLRSLGKGALGGNRNLSGITKVLSNPQLVKAGTFLTKNLNLIAFAAGALTSAFGFLGDQAVANGEAVLKTTTSFEEAKAALESQRKGRLVSSASGIAGRALAAGATGAAIGGIASPVGSVIGGISGILYSLVNDIGSGLKGFAPNLVKKFEESLLGGFVQELSSGLSKIINGIRDELSGGIKIVQDAGSAALDKIYRLAYGDAAVNAENEKANLGVRLNQTKERAGKEGLGFQLNNSDVSDILAKSRIAQGLVLRGSGKNDKERFSSLNDDVQKTITEDLQSLADLFKSINPAQQSGLIEAAKQSGVDLKELFTIVGVETDLATKAQALAFSKLSVFFANIEDSVLRSSAKLSGISAGIDLYSSSATGGSQGVPDQVFDALKSGFSLTSLGLNDFDSSLKSLVKQVNIFDKTLVQAANLEIAGKAAARNTSQSIRGFQVKNTGDPAESLAVFLEEAFNANSGGNQLLNEHFSNFLDANFSQLESLTENIAAGGAIDTSKINSVFDNFASSLEKGAIEQIQKINEINQQFASSYGQVLEQRYAAENEALSFIKASISKQSALFDIKNQGAGLSGSALSAAKKSQAQLLDRRTQSANLFGTGVSANASPQALLQAFRGSKAREGNAAAIAARTTSNPTDAKAREVEIIAAEKDRQQKLVQGLQFIADGTNTAAYAMEEFQQAAQRAAESSKFLTDALLGSDDQLLQTVKGIYAYNKITSAKNPLQAQAALANSSSATKAGLQSVIGLNQESRSAFEQALGFGSGITGSTQQKDAERQANLAIQANEALAGTLAPVIDGLNKSAQQTKEFYTTQFTQMSAIIQAADTTAQNVTKQLAALPEVFKHEGNFTVNLVGAGALEQLNAGIQNLVVTQINAELAKYTEGLIKNNNGLNRPNQ